ncbi:hypothetical protein [Kamptonema sp. UHCC 0994]|uniref:Mom family adenine methylcarbamoylation protein n=1 Tax=Kamptonema sp. UHCC 0994 TaxID=3031329 RepID=UPI0023B891A1|nr:hypothetical protein [Kamptonema sp. UHCC 0994]MDF0554900.1 hypothetical protein [Kamptonema sp. UHCC 0994]
MTVSSFIADKKHRGAKGQTPLKSRLNVERCELGWSQRLVEANHYLHKAVDRRAMPFAYSINLDGEPIGCLIMAVPHWTKQKGLFIAQRQWSPDSEELTQWQVLTISRLWISPLVQRRQPSGHASNIGSCAIAKVLKRVQRDWIEHHPPVFPELPYHLRLIIAHADTSVGHTGKVYQAAGFSLFGQTEKTRPRKSTRGYTNGAVKNIWIKRLPNPNWEWNQYYEQLEIKYA